MSTGNNQEGLIYIFIISEKYVSIEYANCDEMPSNYNSKYTNKL